jgi:hypothetical protein
MAKTELFVRKQNAGVFTAVTEQSSTGNIWWVDSGATSGGADAAGYGRSPASPFLTLDYAIGKCTASNGDVIYVMPGHAESIVGASTLTLDVAGVKIIGLGSGLSIPKFTYTTAAAATFNITAANCHVENLYLYANYTGGVAAGITVGALADGLVLKNIVMEESANTTEFLIGISIAAACHQVTIDGLQFFGVDGGSDTQCIIFVGASNFSVVKNCVIYGDFSGAAIDALTAASTYMTFEKNLVWNTDTTAALVISVKSDTTGMMAYNYCFAPKNNVCPVGAAMAFVQNYTTNVANKNGFYLPAVDT